MIENRIVQTQHSASPITSSLLALEGAFLRKADALAPVLERCGGRRLLCKSCSTAAQTRPWRWFSTDGMGSSDTQADALHCRRDRHMQTSNVNGLKLYQRVADVIVTRIRAGAYKAGHRLPSERDFAEG